MLNFPNQLTTLRIILAPIFGWLSLSSDIKSRLLGISIFTIAVITDFYDGYHARRFKVVSRFGAFLDPLADKILFGIGLFVFVYYGVLSLGMTAIIVGRDIFVTVMRIYAEKKGVPVSTSYLAKVKTFLQSIFLYVLLLLDLFSLKIFSNYTIFYLSNYLIQHSWVHLVAFILCVLSIYTAFEYLYRFIQELKLKTPSY